MKLHIYNKPKKGKPKPEQEIWLKLKQRPDGIIVNAVNKIGKWDKCLIKFHSDGKIYRYTSANCGDFKVDKQGRILIAKETL